MNNNFISVNNYTKVYKNVRIIRNINMVMLKSIPEPFHSGISTVRRGVRDTYVFMSYLSENIHIV